MSNEIQYTSDESGMALYVVIQNAAGQAWTGLGFEDFAGEHWGDYAFALAEAAAGSSRYRGDFPPAITAAGVYRVHIYQQVGAAAALTDPLLAVAELPWDGVAEITPASIKAELAGILPENIDSTGSAPVSLMKAIEVILAVLAGNASFDPQTGIESFRGRDGATTIASTKLTGPGMRTLSTIA